MKLSPSQRDLLLVFCLGFVLRVALLFLFPAPYGNDAAGRLYFRDTIWTWHWLPTTQLLVYGGFALTHSIVVVRLLFIWLGSLAAVAFTFYLQQFVPPRAARLGGVLFTLNAQFIFLSLMPYQEVVFLVLLFGALACFIHDEKYFAWGALLYGLACLTRYEAWFILPALFAVKIWRGRERPLRTFCATALGLGWGPLLWLLINELQWGSATAFLFHRSDKEFYAWAPNAELLRLVNYLGMLSYWLLRFGSPLILFALPGLMLAWEKRKTLLPKIWPLVLLFVMVLVFLLFVAGREFATANRFASIPLAVALVFAALGAETVLTRIEARWRDPQQWAVLKKIGAGIMLLLLCLYGAIPVVKANALPEFRAPYEVAQFLRHHLRAGERALILGESINGAVPMPYQRIYGQLNLPRQDLMCAALLDPRALAEPAVFLREQNMRYIIVFGGSWQKHENDFKLLNFLNANEHLWEPVWERAPAVIYESRMAANTRERFK